MKAATTNEEKQTHSLRFRRFQQSREKFYAPKINEALHKQYLQFTRHVESHGLNALHTIHSWDIERVIRNIYMDAGIIYGSKIRADFAKQGVYRKAMQTKNRRPIGFSETMAGLIADYFKTDILNTSEGITQKTKDLIKDVFTESYKEGLGLPEIIKKLKDTELSKMRAKRIARTETVTAANQGALFVAKDTGLLLNKTWLAAKDSRTRDDHKQHIGIDGHTVGRDDYFIVGGYEMLYPGDRGGHDGKPAVPPKEVVNCRCTVIFQTVRDANGRLVRA